MWRTDPLWVTSLLLGVATLAQEVPWRTRQAQHAPLRLERTGQLQPLALLDLTADPGGQLFDQLLQPILRPRYVGTQAHEEVRQHIASTLAALGWSVDADRTFQAKTPLGQKSFTNVIATLDPAAPRRLVLACHYDSIHGRDRFVAATDSAVPCAMMLYLATLMTRDYLDPTKGRSEVTLQLLFFDGEEAFVRWSAKDSIYGARQAAGESSRAVYQTRSAGQPPLTDLDRIDLFVLLDLLGAAKPAISNYISETNSEFRHLAAVEAKLRGNNQLEDVPRIFRFRKSWGLFGPPRIDDDHLPFQRRGVRVLHVIPYPFPSVWHKNSDNGGVIHRPTVTSLNRILRVFVAEYLRLPDYTA